MRLEAQPLRDLSKGTFLHPEVQDLPVSFRKSLHEPLDLVGAPYRVLEFVVRIGLHGMRLHAHGFDHVNRCGEGMLRPGMVPPPPEIDLDPAVPPVVILKTSVPQRTRDSSQ